MSARVFIGRLRTRLSAAWHRLNPSTLESDRPSPPFQQHRHRYSNNHHYHHRHHHYHHQQQRHQHCQQRLRTLGQCLLSVAGVACWERDGISNRELKQTIDEFWRAFRASGAQNGHNGDKSINGCSRVAEGLLLRAVNEDSAGEDTDDDEEADQWEAIIVKEHFQVWRKAVPGTYLYRYKIFGTFNDVPARAFFQVQMDTEYRKSWDNLVIKLDIVAREDSPAQRSYRQAISSASSYDSKNEVVHWIMHYPFPLYGREYCYIRRAIVDSANNLMVLVSRAIDHPSCPESSKYVRVKTYESSMVIKPHRSFDENGFDYLLTYHDDPQAVFPSMAYNWMAASGVPDFVKQLHKAAYELTVRNKQPAPPKHQQPGPGPKHPAGKSAGGSGGSGEQPTSPATGGNPSTTSSNSNTANFAYA